MRNYLRKTRNSKEKVLFFLIIFCFFAFPLFSGCNETLQQKNSLSGPGGVIALRSKAILIIRQALQDVDPQIRVNAIEVVASTKRMEMMYKVQKLLKDDFVPVRFAAALAVGDTEYKISEKIVKQLLDDPDENVRIAAAYALGEIVRFDSSTFLRKSIGSKKLTVRANATVLLGKMGNQKELRPLYWVLRDPGSDDKVRFQAVEAIARLGDTKILSKIWPMLISIYADDRVMGIKALGVLGTSQAKDILITKLDDDVLVVRLVVAEQLGLLGDDIGKEVILEIFSKNLMAPMDKDEKQEVKVFTALAIGSICTEELTRFLPKLLADDSKLVRISAAKAVFQCINAN